MGKNVWKSSKIGYRYANGEILSLFHSSIPGGMIIRKFTFKEIMHDRLSQGERICIENYFDVRVKIVDPSTYMFLRPGMKVQLLLKERKSRRVTGKLRKYYTEASLIDLMVFDIAPTPTSISTSLPAA